MERDAAMNVGRHLPRAVRAVSISRLCSPRLGRLRFPSREVRPKDFGMQIKETELPGLFLESWSQRIFDQAVGEKVSFVQDNRSRSAHGVLRGLHYQTPPHAQVKLVSVLSETIYDVVVDLRNESQTFGKPLGLRIDAESCVMLWMPPRFAHSERICGCGLQGHGLLFARPRALYPMGRSGPRYPLATPCFPARALGQRCRGIKSLPIYERNPCPDYRHHSFHFFLKFVKHPST